MLHEQELSTAKLYVQNEERSLQESMASKLQGRIEEERLAAKEELKLSARALQDKAAAELDTAKREHRKVLQRQTDDLERDLERHRLFLKDKALQARDRAHSDMKLLQESSQQRILELQQRHAKHIETLQGEHEHDVSIFPHYITLMCKSSSFHVPIQMKTLKRQAEAQRKAHQSALRRELHKNSGAGSYDDSDEEIRPRSTTSRGSNYDNGSAKDGFSPQHSSVGKGSPTRSYNTASAQRKSAVAVPGGKLGSLRLENIPHSTRSDDNDDDGTGCDSTGNGYGGGIGGELLQPEDELELAAVMRAAQEDRDRQIQSEIRALESETLRLERQWRAHAEAEEKQALAAVAAEVEYSTIRKQRQQYKGTGMGRGSNDGQGRSTGAGGGGEDLAELVVTREQLIQQVQTLKGQAERAAAEESEVIGEVQVYKEGISAHRARIQDKQEQHRLRLRELQLEAGPRLRELREQAEAVAVQIREGAERCRKQMSAVDKEHSLELARLDAQVKSEVARRDEENEALRDAVEAEATKIARLERLINQYISVGCESSLGSDGGGGGFVVGDIYSNKSNGHQSERKRSEKSDISRRMTGGRSVASTATAPACTSANSLKSSRGGGRGGADKSTGGRSSGGGGDDRTTSSSSRERTQPATGSSNIYGGRVPRSVNIGSSAKGLCRGAAVHSPTHHSVEESMQKVRLNKTAGPSTSSGSSSSSRISSRGNYSSSTFNRRSVEQQLQNRRAGTLPSGVGGGGASRGGSSGSREEQEAEEEENGDYRDYNKVYDEEGDYEEEEEGDEPNPLPAWILEKQTR